MYQDKTKFLKQQVPLQARKWLNTRFHHQGRTCITKNSPGAVDCIGLVLGVAKELGIQDGRGNCLTRHDIPAYSRIGVGTLLVDVLNRNLNEVNSIDPGDILLFRFMGQPQHVGIVGEKKNYLTLIHAYQGSNRVVEHELTDKWKSRIIGIYRFKTWQQ